MTTAVLSPSQSKTNYYSLVRSEIRPLLTPCERLLDLGCGEGQTAAWIKSQGLAEWVAGIELSLSAAARARCILNDVRTGDIETAEVPFSDLGCILCLDVLEHLRHPESVLRKLAQALKSDGVVVASIPNIGNWRVAIPLLFGRWEYADSGLLDRTHLRFYNQKSALKLFSDSGFRVEKVIAKPGDKYSAMCNAMCLGRVPLFHFQYLIRARKL